MGVIQLPRSYNPTFFPVFATLVLFFFSDPARGVSQTDQPSYSFLQEATTSPTTSYYDYIVIGGGTAGCPLAATLSRHYKVLLLERGGSPYGNPNITDLSAFGHALADLSPSSPSQPFVSKDGVYNARARVLGGGSCINAGFYSRAATGYVTTAGWDGSLVNASYKWVEDEVAFEPQVKQWQSGIRDALMEIGMTPYNGFTYDHIQGTKVGGTIFDDQGRRHTAADLLKEADPANLTVLLHASVHRILFRKTISGTPRAHGVIFKDAEGGRHKAYINKGSKNEIILSAGALGSPQLLMLSGIGPKAHLQAHNISVLLDQPNVGQGMADNPMNAVYVPSPVPIEVSLIEIVGITPFGSYIEAVSGENFGGSQSQTNQISTSKVAYQSPLSNQLGAQVFQGGFIFEKIAGPLSSGHLEITSRDVDDTPEVTFNYFREPEDLARCAKGIRTIQKIITSNAFSKFKPEALTLQTLLNLTAGGSMNLLPKHENTSTSPEQYCKDTVMTIWHYHGGCQVGKVVDREYRVYGVHGLRVVDGSTFLSSPGTNPQATVMMLGRYVGLKLLRARLRSKNINRYVGS